MSAVYNEIEPFAADWLDRLIDGGHIAHGKVYRRSIRALSDRDVRGPGQRHFFAGIGGWSRALRLAGVPDSASVWTGSCPCQPFSQAGSRNGTDDDLHLWPDWFRLIAAVRPAIIFGEQVASPDGLAWFDVVSADMEGAGYTVVAADLCAASVGAPHIRQRLYFGAVANGAGQGLARPDARLERAGQRWSRSDGRMGDPGLDGDRQHARELHRDESEHDERGAHGDHAPIVAGSARDPWRDVEWVGCRDGRRRPVEPGTFPLAHGVSERVGQLRGYGNAIVPELAATFVEAVGDLIDEMR